MAKANVLVLYRANIGESNSKAATYGIFCLPNYLQTLFKQPGPDQCRAFIHLQNYTMQIELSGYEYHKNNQEFIIFQANYPYIKQRHFSYFRPTYEDTDGTFSHAIAKFKVKAKQQTNPGN